jgi:tetratricopeptide (TPR) repeat protein
MAQKDSQITDTLRDSLYHRITGNFIVIWLDFDIHDMNDSILELHHAIHFLQIFEQPDPCIDFLTDISDQKIFLILSDTLGEMITPLIHDIYQLDSIYIFSDNSTKPRQWPTQWRKVKGIFTDVSSICVQLKQNVRQCEQDLIPISIIPMGDSLTRDLNELDPSFMYTKLLKEILLEMEHDELSKAEFIEYCHTEYTDQKTKLRAVDEFDRNYDPNSPIWWYTKEPFIYATLNKALRTQNVEIVLKMGFFVRDLHRQIHSENSPTTKMIVYRGQGMLNDEFERIKMSEGGLLSFNNFLSTSADRQVSFAFADSAQQDPTLTGILFEIEIDPSISSTPFALLDGISHYSDSEKEILFSMHTVFRIGEIHYIENRLWSVQLTMTSDTDEQLQSLTDQMRIKTQKLTDRLRLTTLMIVMGEISMAEILSKILLKKTSSDDLVNIGLLYFQLGRIYQTKNDATTAMSYYEKTLEIQQKFPPSNRLLQLTGATYNNIGAVQHLMGDYAAALSYYQRALDIQEKILPSDDSDLTTTYNNIGAVHMSMEDYSTALSYIEKALEMRQKSLSSTHPDLARTYNDIGFLHFRMGNHSIASSFYEKTLRIQQKSLPSTHLDIAITYNTIGWMHDTNGDHSTALSYYEKALEIQMKSLSPVHSLLYSTYNLIASVYKSMRDYPNALLYYEKILEMKQKILPPNHLDFATIYLLLGTVHSSNGCHTTALSYYQKTLDIQLEALPPGHLDLAITYNFLGIQWEYHRIKKSLKYNNKLFQTLIQIWPKPTRILVRGTFLQETTPMHSFTMKKHLQSKKILVHLLIPIYS